MRRLMKNSWKSKEEPVQIHLHFSPLLPPPAQRWLKFICYNRDTLISIKLFAIFVIPVYDASRFMLHFAGRKFSTFNTFPLVEHCSRLGHCQWSVIVVHFELPISFSIPCLFQIITRIPTYTVSSIIDLIKFRNMSSDTRVCFVSLSKKEIRTTLLLGDIKRSSHMQWPFFTVFAFTASFSPLFSLHRLVRVSFLPREQRYLFNIVHFRS